MSAPIAPVAATGVVGQSNIHESAVAQVMGAAPYLDDLARCMVWTPAQR